MRDALIDAVLAFLDDEDLLDREDARAGLEREIDESGPDALARLQASLTADTGWSYHPPDPLARRLHHHLAARFLDASSRVIGADSLAISAGTPLVLLSNHLSYADANVVEILLHRSGHSAVADRLTAIAGPKVFSSRQRRFSSLCFGTIKVPQSADVATGEAAMGPREIAIAARESLSAAHARLKAGDALLLFAEGTRSRTGAMSRILPGCARYFDVPETVVVPIGLIGTENLYPLGATKVQLARVELAVGPVINASDLIARTGGNRRLMADALGQAVAQQLPVAYRGAYRSEPI